MTKAEVFLIVASVGISLGVVMPVLGPKLEQLLSWFLF